MFVLTIRQPATPEKAEWLLALEELLKAPFGTVWEQVRGECGLKKETLARAMWLTPQQHQQQLTGQGHVSFQRFVLLLIDPDCRVFAQRLLNRIFAEAGLANVEPFSELVKQLFALAVKTHMAKAQLDDVRAERRQAARRRIA